MLDNNFTGIKVKELRQLAGLTQIELSKKLNISRRSVQRLESSKSVIEPSLQQKIQIIFGKFLTSYELVKTETLADLKGILSQLDSIKKNINQVIDLYE